MGSLQIAKIKGIPIKLHITLLILLPLMAGGFAFEFKAFAYLWGIAMAIGLFASIIFHELGHSFIAVRKGCRIHQILLLPIGGLAQFDRMPAKAEDEFQMALAGPAVSLILSMLLSLPHALAAENGFVNTAIFLERLSWLNMMLALFNLIPSFPMDGGRIFRAWLTPKIGKLAATRMAAKTGRFIAVIFFIWGLWTPFNPFLLLIAVFIYQAAGSEYRMVMMQEGGRTYNAASFSSNGRQRTINNDDIYISPPPYAKEAPRKKAQENFIRKARGMFDDLFQKWQG